MCCLDFSVRLVERGIVVFDMNMVTLTFGFNILNLMTFNNIPPLCSLYVTDNKYVWKIGELSTDSMIETVKVYFQIIMTFCCVLQMRWNCDFNLE